jgi:CheY-like chemotaxis protein
MFDRDYAVTGVMGSPTPAELDESPARHNSQRITRTALPLSPHQALAKRSAKSSASLRSVARKSRPETLPLSVLVVDDVHDVTEMIALFLKHAGYQVFTADSAPAALRLAEEQNFDLIISDIGMPEMNGYELAAALRRLSEYRSIPMIAVTGYTEYDDRGRALQAGFSAHLTKPIDPSQLLDLMNTLLG